MTDDFGTRGPGAKSNTARSAIKGRLGAEIQGHPVSRGRARAEAPGRRPRLLLADDRRGRGGDERSMRAEGAGGSPAPGTPGLTHLQRLEAESIQILRE